MAKTKKERNMSALDYLYKKLNWLINKIETSSGGKVSKRDLIIYICIGIFIVSVYFGKVIGGFTFVLVLVTLWNARITQGLLKRSAETFEQSRISFLVDIVHRTIEYVEKVPIMNREARQIKYIKNKTRAIKRINIERAIEFLQAMIEWYQGKFEDRLGEGKFEDLQEELKELEKEKKGSINAQNSNSKL